jgi:subtilisin family serine protease
MVRGFRRLGLICSLLLPFATTACHGGYYYPPATPASATPSGTGTPTSTDAFICPSSDSIGSSAAASTLNSLPRRPEMRHHATIPGSGFIEVTYDRTVAEASTAAIARREQSLGAGLVHEFDYPRTGIVTRVLAVAPANVAKTEAALRGQSGVRSVSLSGARRLPLTVSNPYYSNDPYFNGFKVTETPAPGETAPPATYHVAPYDQSAAVPGQWDMHAIGLDYAFEYSQATNGSAITKANALGSQSVKIAIIDTGEDPTHPELESKIAYQKCYITDSSGVQSTSSFSADPTGHGTDVSGIAAADTNNGLGFTGAGGNVLIYAYRIFPTPDDDCEDPSTTDSQCGADTADIASAIDDAVAQKVNVISISLGAGGCTNGVDDDPVESQALTNALNANIIVVAAAGNEGNSAVDAPACQSGVIAVGASALDDGQPNGSGIAVGTPSTPVEYVATYSNYGSPATAVHSASAWGIVAPGGDPLLTGTDPDQLHWIDNIWTSTPYMADSSDTSFTGECDDDYPNDSSTTPPVDCRTLIAGTSMATPHVAGAAALLLSVNSSYQSPAKMMQLLCSTADDIKDGYEGCGRLNVYRAMATALGDTVLP